MGNIISKDEACKHMNQAGYTCEVIAGVLTFTDKYPARIVKQIDKELEKIGYEASWAIKGKGI